jgi:uncharacterized protein YxjI
MAAQFCMNCGKPLPDGAQFCAACGTPVTGAAAATAPAGAAGIPPPPPPPPSAAAPVAGPPLGQVLGIQGGRSFLVQHLLGTGGRSYRVMDPEKRHLFTVKENYGEEMRSNLLGGMLGNQVGFGGTALNRQTLAWTVHDAGGAVRGNITFQINGYHANSTLTDGAGTPVLMVHVDRGLVGGMTANAALPDGRPMFQSKGNLIHHNFTIHDPAGQEVAKVHEAWASVRDTYRLDLAGPVDPLGPLIFAILIDREKGTT